MIMVLIRKKILIHLYLGKSFFLWIVACSKANLNYGHASITIIFLYTETQIWKREMKQVHIDLFGTYFFSDMKTCEMKSFT